MRADECGRLVTMWFCAAFLIALFAGSMASLAQQDRILADGQADYELHCVACHGSKGQGDGKMAELLIVQPSDLTRIASDNEGLFPTWRVYGILEGREQVKGHETFQMPLFADRFRHDEGKPGYPPAHIRVLLLTHYVESLQAD